ncbi:MAG: NAD(P)/FAD-dependent oxidoreductase [Armatimonadetes bacterium]|nr:NAD(P)/FAD-dependent oxidoreductase [Armatimonadota bacterium]
MRRSTQKRASPGRARWGKWWWTAAGLSAGAAVAWNGARALRRQQLRERIITRRPEGSRVVVLGAGFAGLKCAEELCRRLPHGPNHEVTLVDRHNYQLFAPLLYHVATGIIDPSHILFPVRSLPHLDGLRFVQSVVRGVDFESRRVLLEDDSLEYDQLVITLGSTTNYFGHEEWARHTFPLKNLGDAIALRNQVITCYERAERLPPGPQRAALLTFVVVGGGATGVELMGALNGLVYGALRRQYPRISPREARLILIEAHDVLLHGFGRDMGRPAYQSLTRRGVDVRLGTSATEVTPDGIRVQSPDQQEFIPSAAVVWAAGVRPVSVVRYLDAPHAPGGRLLVDPYLQVLGQPHVYALGDCAAVPDPTTGGFLPPMAAIAVQQGSAVAETIAARLAGEEPRSFRYRHYGEMISLGRHEALADVFGVRLSGVSAWLLWRAFYLWELMGARNRLGVALDWSFAYFYARETVQLSCVPEWEPEAIVPEEVSPPTGRIIIPVREQPDTEREPVPADD